MGATTSKEMWDFLKKEFQGNAKVSSVKLRTNPEERFREFKNESF